MKRILNSFRILIYKILKYVDRNAGYPKFIFMIQVKHIYLVPENEKKVENNVFFVFWEYVSFFAIFVFFCFFLTFLITIIT